MVCYFTLCTHEKPKKTPKSNEVKIFLLSPFTRSRKVLRERQTSTATKKKRKESNNSKPIRKLEELQTAAVVAVWVTYCFHRHPPNFNSFFINFKTANNFHLQLLFFFSSPPKRYILLFSNVNLALFN